MSNNAWAVFGTNPPQLPHPLPLCMSLAVPSNTSNACLQHLLGRPQHRTASTNSYLKHNEPRQHKTHPLPEWCPPPEISPRTRSSPGRGRLSLGSLTPPSKATTNKKKGCCHTPGITLQQHTSKHDKRPLAFASSLHHTHARITSSHRASALTDLSERCFLGPINRANRETQTVHPRRTCGKHSTVSTARGTSFSLSLVHPPSRQAVPLALKNAQKQKHRQCTLVEEPHSTLPPSASSRPAMRLNSVVLPAPLGPTCKSPK